MRRLKMEVRSEIPTAAARRVFRSLLGAVWALLREEPIGPLEAVGIGFTWYSGLGEGARNATLPSPWVLVRNCLIETGAISPKAHVYALRSEVVHIRKPEEHPRLLLQMERA